MSLLLDQDFDLHIDKKVKKRIIDSVKKKSQLNFSNNENILDKFRNILKYLFVNKRLATLCTIFMLFVGSGGYLYAQVPVAYVSLDINPSIELALNKFNKVVSYEAYNPDGEILLTSNNKTHITLDNAINNIIANAINKNYISSSKDSTITLSAISDDTILRKDLEIHLKDAIEESLENKSIHLSINSSNNNLNKRNEAKSIGFTVGKLLLVQELKSLDSSIIIEDFKDTSISEIKNKILESKNNNSNDDSTTNIADTDISDTDNGSLHSVDKSTSTSTSTSSTSNIIPSNSNNGNTTSNPSSNSNNGNASSNSSSNSNNGNASSNPSSNSNNGNASSNSNSNSNKWNASSHPHRNSNKWNASSHPHRNSNKWNTPSNPNSNSNKWNASSNSDKDKDKNHGPNLHKNGDD